MATVFNRDDQENLTNRPGKRDRRPAHTEPLEAEVVAEAAAIYPDTFATPPSEEEIAREAYLIYLARGSQHGHDRDDWFEAERRVHERRARPGDLGPASD